VVWRVERDIGKGTISGAAAKGVNLMSFRLVNGPVLTQFPALASDGE
jgi:hypothetical protein